MSWRIGSFEITTKELILAVAIAVIGFVFSLRGWIYFLDKIPLWASFTIYELIFFIILYVFGKLDLIVFGVKVNKFKHTLGLWFIVCALMICINWTSPYVNIVTHDTIDGVSPIYFASEDGVVWWLWEQTGLQNVEWLRILTYIFTPFILTLIGVGLLSETPKFVYGDGGG